MSSHKVEATLCLILMNKKTDSVFVGNLILGARSMRHAIQ